MNYYYFLIAILIVASPPCLSLQNGSSVICLKTDFNHGKSKVGTGFFIAPGLLATASHQINDSGLPAVKVMAYLDKDRSFKLNLPVIAEGDGIALMTAANPSGLDYLLLRDLNHENDLIISAVGCQKDYTRLIQKGEILQAKADNLIGRSDISGLIPLKLMIKEGFSGSPLRTENGEVVGVVYGYNDLSESLSYAIPSETLLRLLEGKNKSEFIKTLNYQGFIAFKLKEYVLARKYFERLILNEPKNFEAYVSLGTALFKLKQYEAARDALLEAVLLNSDYPLAYYHLGGVYMVGLSDIRSAMNAYQQYLKLAPTSPDAPKVREWIQELEQKTVD